MEFSSPLASGQQTAAESADVYSWLLLNADAIGASSTAQLHTAGEFHRAMGPTGLGHASRALDLSDSTAGLSDVRGISHEGLHSPQAHALHSAAHLSTDLSDVVRLPFSLPVAGGVQSAAVDQPAARSLLARRGEDGTASLLRAQTAAGSSHMGRSDTHGVMPPPRSDALGRAVASLASRSSSNMSHAHPQGPTHSNSMSNSDDDYDDDDDASVVSDRRGGAQRAGARGGGRAGGGEDNRKRSRLEKNRESARESRRRKREHVSLLEKKVNDLEEEVASLKLMLRVGAENKQVEEQEKALMTAHIQRLLASGSNEAELERVIKEFGERFADYGKDRRTMLQFHLERVEKLLAPTQVTKMCLWSLQQPDEFYDDQLREEDMPGGTIYHILTRHLDLTSDQKRRIKEYRATVRGRAMELRRCTTLIRELHDLAVRRTESLDADMGGIQSVLTPTQIAKFILWVDHNPACMHMLNQLWNATVVSEPAAIAAAGAVSHSTDVADSTPVPASSASSTPTPGAPAGSIPTTGPVACSASVVGGAGATAPAAALIGALPFAPVSVSAGSSPSMPPTMPFPAPTHAPVPGFAHSHIPLGSEHTARVPSLLPLSGAVLGMPDHMAGTAGGHVAAPPGSGPVYVAGAAPVPGGVLASSTVVGAAGAHVHAVRDGGAPVPTHAAPALTQAAYAPTHAHLQHYQKPEHNSSAGIHLSAVHSIAQPPV